MKQFILALAALCCLALTQTAQAGAITAQWEHNNQDINNQPIVLSHFKLYWGLSGQGLTNVISVGPPLPVAVSVVNGVSTYRLSMAKPSTEWPLGANICMRVTALAMNGTTPVESAKSAQACKIITYDPPNAPTNFQIIQ